MGTGEKNAHLTTLLIDSHLNHTDYSYYSNNKIFMNSEIRNILYLSLCESIQTGDVILNTIL